MQIHVVTAGQTLWSIGAQYGVAPGLLARFNGLTEPYRLSVGESLLILKPAQLYTVQPGDSVYSISQTFSLGRNELYRLNPGLSAQERLYPGQVLVTKLEDTPNYEAQLMGYAYPWVSGRVLRGILPYAQALAPFTYGFTETGELVRPDDEQMRALAKDFGVTTLLHLSTLTEQGSFSAQSAGAVLENETARAALIRNTVREMRDGGFVGIDVDFEFLGKALAASYAAFLQELSQAVHTAGGYLMAAVAPKTSDTQPGVLYEGHDYAAIGKAVDQVLLMTYEWGYTYGPPMAVAPLPNVRAVLDYAVTEIPAEKILLGVPNYGYDWPLPYRQGETRAESLSNEEAVRRAIRYGAEIQFDESAQAPWYRYTAPDGTGHEVWFEDARAQAAKLRLVAEYGFLGMGYWNIMRPAPQTWLVLSSLYDVD